MPEPARYRDILREEQHLLARYGDENYAHDMLGPINRPVYFRDFVEHAERHRLQYLSDNAIAQSLRGLYSPAAIDKLNQLAKGQRLVREQYRDFLDGRLFRETLLCRQEITLADEPRPERVQGLYVASPRRRPPPQPGPPGMAEFQLPGGETMQLDHPLAKAALSLLGERWPAALPFRDVLAEARCRIGATSANEAAAVELAEFLLIAESRQFVTFSVHAPRLAPRVSERPLGSPLAPGRSGKESR